MTNLRDALGLGLGHSWLGSDPVAVKVRAPRTATLRPYAAWRYEPLYLGRTIDVGIVRVRVVDVDIV